MKQEKINNTPENQNQNNQWEELEAMHDEWRRLQGLEDMPSPSDKTSEEMARAYNESVGNDTMHDEWRRLQGLEDMPSPSDKTSEEMARAYNESVSNDTMHDEWRRLQGLEDMPSQNNENEAIQAQWDDLNQSMEDAATEWQKEHEDGEASGDGRKILIGIEGDKNKRIAQLEGMIDENNREIASIDEEIEELKNKRIEELEGMIADNNKEIASIDEEIIELNNQRIDEIDKEIEKILEMHPLTAINADASLDRKELARDEAERIFNDEKSNSGFFKRIGMNFLEKYFKMKYEKQILNGDRKVLVDDKEISLDDALQDRSKGAVGRMVKSVAENEMGYVHENFDESRDREADTGLTEVVRNAISEYAEARGDGADEQLFKAKLREQMERLRMDSGDPNFVNNYFEVAENAIKVKDMARGALSLDKVLDKVAVYNATIHDGARSELHRSKIDTVLEKYESSKFGSIVKPEVLAVAAGVVSVLAKSGSSKAASLIVPGGGIAFAGAMAGVREHNRVTNDRERMLRDIEGGMGYADEEDVESATNGRERRMAKYEAKIGNTVYQVEKASDLTKNIEDAVESGDSEKILEAIASAKVRIEMSDSDRKGLIAFSSETKRGDERLALDTAVIHAKRALSDEDKQKLAEIEGRIQDEIYDDIDEKDSKFKRLRAAQVAKQVAKTVAIGATTFIASQEIMAAMSPDKVGLLEKIGLLKTSNNANAQETIIASAFPQSHDSIQLTSDQQNQIDQLEQAGYKKVKIADGTTEIRNTHSPVDPANSSHKANVMVREWANNGTIPYDGNELNVSEVSPGNYVTNMVGESTTPSGKVLNFQELANSGRIKGFLTLDGNRFEVQGFPDGNGQFVFCKNGVFTTPDGDIIRAVGSNGERFYEFFEVGASMGTDPASGMEEFIPMATAVGNDGPFTGTFEELTRQVIETPDTYSLIPPTPEVTYAGIPIPPPSARVGLGGPYQGVVEAEPTGTAGSPDTPPQEPAPEPAVGVARDPGSASDAAPDTGPATPASGESSDAQAPSDEEEPTLEKEREYLSYVRRASERLGENVTNMLIETIDRAPEYYTNFWNSLTEEQKNYVTILSRAADETVAPGRALRNWLEAMNNQATA